jgi:serine O-acetyltransferase
LVKKLQIFRNLIEHLDSIRERDPAARGRLEIFLLYSGFHAMLHYRFAHWLWQVGLPLAGRIVSQCSRVVTGIEIHPAAKIGRRLFIDHGMGVVIGETATLGDDVTLYHDVTLGGTSWQQGIRHPQVGNRVIVGAGAQLLGPIRIGDGAHIGSNAVVVKDVPAGATMVGVPAHAAQTRAMAAGLNAQAGFEAYGATRAEDPLVKALERMTQQLREMQRRIDLLEAQQADGEKTAQNWNTAQ